MQKYKRVEEKEKTLRQTKLQPKRSAIPHKRLQQQNLTLFGAVSLNAKDTAFFLFNYFPLDGSTFLPKEQVLHKMS